jgi:regulator of cell morphogenesis and NO signaling
MTSCDLDSSVPDWIIDHPETTCVFETWGIDSSCGGKSLAYACRERGINADDILRQLHAAINSSDGDAERPHRK